MNTTATVFLLAVILAFLFLAIQLGLAVLTNFRRAGEMRRQLGYRIMSLPMFRMLQTCNVPLQQYLHHHSIHEIERQVRNCESCQSKSECESGLKQVHSDELGRVCINYSDFQELTSVVGSYKKTSLSTSNGDTMKKLLLLFVVVALVLPVAQAEQGDWLIRARGIGIVPDDSSNQIDLGGTTLTGSGVEADSYFVPEIDITYMVTRNIGIEAIAGISNHDVNLTGPGPALGGLGLTDGFKLFDTWVLPPTVTLQYHFLPDNSIRPYLGMGVNYTATLWDDATDNLEAAVGPVTVNSSNSWGWAAQAGVDIDWKDNWYFNIDLKYIDFDTEASLHTALGTLRVDLDVDPFVIGAGIGYRFR